MLVLELIRYPPVLLPRREYVDAEARSKIDGSAELSPTPY